MTKFSKLNWFAFALSFIVIIGISWLVYKQWDEIVAFPWQLNIWFLLLVLFFHSLALMATFWAWHLMVSRLGNFKNISINFHYYYISTLAKRIPTSIPYIGGRLAMYRQSGVPTAAIANCILLENILIGIGGIFVFLILLPFYSNTPKEFAIPALAIGAVFAGIFAIKPQILIEKTNWLLRKLKKPGLTTVPNRRDIFTWIIVYIFPWLFAGLSLYYAPQAFSSNQIPVWDAIGISTLATLVSLVYLIIPGGMGLKELTSSILLANWMPISTAIIISLMYRLIHTLNEIIWVLIALLGKSMESSTKKK